MMAALYAGRSRNSGRDKRGEKVCELIPIRCHRGGVAEREVRGAMGLTEASGQLWIFRENALLYEFLVVRVGVHGAEEEVPNFF